MHMEKVLMQTRNRGLIERQEAAKIADVEFDRVKRAKLEAERLKAKKFTTNVSEISPLRAKVKQREMANRASAAASRARMVVYCKDLEVRVDRLEEQRNSMEYKVQRAIKKADRLSGENRSVKKVLRQLYEMKDPKVTDLLVKTDALLLLSPAEKSLHEESESEDDSD